MNLFQILAGCEGLEGVISVIKTILNVLRWIIPVTLIIYGTVDMFKAMTKEKEEDQKKIRETFIRRLIYAIVAFMIPLIVTWVFGLAGNLTKEFDSQGNLLNANVFTCWNVGKAKNDAESNLGTCRIGNNTYTNVPMSNCDGGTWTAN